MKILVIGSAGMLGQDVVREFTGDHQVIRSTTSGENAEFKLDITSPTQVEEVLASADADLVINCAAYTAVDLCEENRDLAFQVNGEGPGNIARACAAQNRTLFHISTDYVFDGEKGEAYVEDDQPAPRSVYGESKLAGEVAVLDSGCLAYIGRVQWLYGAGGPNFAETMLKLADKMPELKVVDDQRGCPTWTVEVARCMRRIIEASDPGVYHMAAKGETTWYGFTRAILKAAGKGDFPVNPCTTEEFPRPAHRPKNSALCNHRLEQGIGDEMLPWDAVIDDYLRSRK